MGENMDAEGTMAYAYYKDGASNPTFLFPAYALDEVKCWQISTPLKKWEADCSLSVDLWLRLLELLLTWYDGAGSNENNPCYSWCKNGLLAYHPILWVTWNRL